MKRANGARGAHGLPILLLSLGAAVGSACWWTLAPPTTADPEAAIAQVVTRTLQESPSIAAADARSAQPLAPQSTTDSPRQQRPLRPGSERELRAKYLALEASTPGQLAARAQEWLTGSRTTAEKVAWLQALHEHDAAAAIPWLEFACGLEDPSSPQGEAASAFALGFLQHQASRESSALGALGRVALDATRVDVALRRRAAATFAAHADATQLQALGQGLLHEADESLRAGVVVALEARTQVDTRSAVEGLLAWLRPASAVFLARPSDGAP